MLSATKVALFPQSSNYSHHYLRNHSFCFFWKDVGMSFVGTFVRLLFLGVPDCHRPLFFSLWLLINDSGICSCCNSVILSWYWWQGIILWSSMVSANNNLGSGHRLCFCCNFSGISYFLPHTFYIVVAILLVKRYTSYIALQGRGVFGACLPARVSEMFVCVNSLPLACWTSMQLLPVGLSIFPLQS